MEVYAQFGNGIAMRDRLISKTGGTTMEKPLADIYRDYIACLNRRDWDNLGRFVHQTVSHNDRPFGLAGYRAMLEQDFKAIPDLQFNIELLVSEPPTARPLAPCSACRSTAAESGLRKTSFTPSRMAL
jgi:hypothetical protein